MKLKRGAGCSLKGEARAFTRKRRRDSAYERDKKARQREGSWIETLEVTRRRDLEKALKIWGVLDSTEENDRQAIEEGVANVLNRWADDVLRNVGE